MMAADRTLPFLAELAPTAAFNFFFLYSVAFNGKSPACATPSRGPLAVPRMVHSLSQNGNAWSLPVQPTHLLAATN